MTDPDERAHGMVIGVVPGVNPGRWIRAWNERFPRNPATVVVIDEAVQVEALVAGDVTMCFVRSFAPDQASDFHVVPLFEEQQVVAVPRHHVLAEWDEVEIADLRDESLVQSPDDVPGWTGGGETPLSGEALSSPAAERLRLVADGVGVLILPMSVARLHARRDVTAVPVADLPALPVGLAWLRSADAQETQDFVAVVRGRTARSSRTSGPEPVKTSEHRRRR